MRAVLINGEVVSPQTASISVYDRGFLYGDSVFETIRTYRGSPFALDEHLSRLARSAERVFIPLPVSLEVLAREVLLGTKVAQNSESYIRVMLTRGTGPMGLDPDLAEHPSRLILVDVLSPPSAELYEQGIEVITVRAARATDATAAQGAKVGNYLASLLAIREARRKGAAEALMVDPEGCVLEGATSNVFIVKDRALYTAPEESGILAGITCAHILKIAAAMDLAVVLGDVKESALAAADEVFISSSIREILAVVRVEGRTVGDGTPGPVTRALHAAFRRHVAAEPV